MNGIKFKFKLNPLDISSIYLCDGNKYIEIKHADPEFGPLSLEEFLFIKSTLIKNKIEVATEAIMKTYEDINDINISSQKNKRKLQAEFKRATSRGNDLKLQFPFSDHEEMRTEFESKPSKPYSPKKLLIDLSDTPGENDDG